MIAVPPSRVLACNDAPPRSDGRFVLYWMTAYRRMHHNFALDRAVFWASELRKPLLVVEALGCGHQWASARFHTFVIQGMQVNQRAASGLPVTYYPVIETSAAQGRGMMHAFTAEAAVVVTDDFPAFEIPGWIRAVAARSPVLVEKVDSNGLLPMREAGRVFKTAHSFRRHLQKSLSAHLPERPSAMPLDGLDLPRLKVPKPLESRWPMASSRVLGSPTALVQSLPIDQAVTPVESAPGGSDQARTVLRDFMKHRLDRYAETRNEPEENGTSGLSPYLHFGQISSHEIFGAIVQKERWSIASLAAKATGSRAGWWGMPAPVEAFLDQLVTWRELGFNMCASDPAYDRFESLPDWSRKTLARHGADPRPFTYSPAQFESASTHDALWNAAQRQLVTDGLIHGYLRMLWGKKILEWSPTPETALATMIHLNNKFALDGRDPNSYSGIFWTLGRYDRPWGPERPVFGTVRFMSSVNTARKIRVRQYIAQHQG